MGKKLGLLAIESVAPSQNRHSRRRAKERTDIGSVQPLATHIAKFGRRVDDWHVLIWLAVTAFEVFSAMNLRQGGPIRLASPGQRGVYQTQR